jgi:hypothetical protein
MIKTIIKNLDLESDIKLISPIDEIKLSLKKDTFCNIILKDPIEQYIQELLCSKESKVINLFNTNYFNNVLLNIYFIIGNPYCIDTKIFNIIYKNKHLISKIPNLIIDIYDVILYKKSNFFLYYNHDIIKRWYYTILPRKLSNHEYYKTSKLSDKRKAIQWAKYNQIWDIYYAACIVVKKYLKNVLKFYKPLTINVVGCSFLGVKYYEYCVESYLGMNVNIIKLETWAYTELEMLKDRMKFYCQLVNIHTKDYKKDYKSLLKKIFNNDSQKFKSKYELVNLYKTKIKKYEHIFVDLLDFPQYEKSNLVIFSNAKLGGGYYNLNNFYLNINDWKNMRKYKVESLVLHETNPGHHTQFHTMLHKPNKYGLLFGYFGNSCTGFIEGWGLFSEQLGFEQSIWDKIGQIEFEIFRTLRIIVDIGLHYHGKTPNAMIELMQNNLTMSKKSIENEIYRYVCQPGQAVAYKVGSQVFKKILEKNNIHNFTEPKAIELYKKIINDGPKPLKFICKDYNIKKNELFN